MIPEFRAYNIALNEMYYEAEKSSSHNYISPTFILHNKNYAPFSDEFILMQWTGMIDKNGKKIFQGDLLNYKRGDEMKFDDDYADSVEFEDGMFLLKGMGEPLFITIKRKTYPTTGETWTKWEVIGNIYETKL